MRHNKSRAIRPTFINCTFTNISASRSVVAQGNRGSFSVHNGVADNINEQAQELLRIFRALPMRQKVNLLSICYDFYDGTEGDNHAVNTEKDH